MALDLKHAAQGDFDTVFRSAVRARAGALVTLSSPVFHTYRRLLVDLAAKHRLPAIMPFPLFAGDGGLIAYGQAGQMVGKILKGAKARDLPVERSSSGRTG